MKKIKKYPYGGTPTNIPPFTRNTPTRMYDASGMFSTRPSNNLSISELDALNSSYNLGSDWLSRWYSQRNVPGLEPGKKVTLKDVQKLRENDDPNVRELFMIIRGDSDKEVNTEVKSLLNELVDASEDKGGIQTAKYGKMIKKYGRGGQAGWRNPDGAPTNTYGPRTFGGQTWTPNAAAAWTGNIAGAPTYTPNQGGNTGFDFGALMPLFADSFGGFLNRFNTTDPSTWMEGLTPGSIEDFGLDQAGMNQANQMADQFGSVFGMMEQLEQFRNRPQDMFNPAHWTVNPSRGMFQLGGDVESTGQDGVLAIQTEKGEEVIMPDNTISKAKAKKKHSQMKDDEVTDILPEGAFVGSADKKMRVTKDEMKELTLGYTPIEYVEGETSKPPKEITAADIMDKNKMTPAEYIRKIKSAYPNKKATDDPFAIRADMENLDSRTPFIAAIKHMTEMKKPKSERQEVPQARLGYMVPPTEYYNNLNFNPVQAYNYGYGGRVPKAATGMEIAALANMFGDFNPLSMFGNIANNLINMQAQRRANRLQREANAQAFGVFETGMDRLEDMFTQGADRQRGFLGAGTALGIAGDLLQDTDFTAPQLDTRFVDALPQEMPRTAMNQARRDMRMASRPGVNYAMRNAPSFSRGMNAVAMNQANQMQGISSLAGQQALANLNLRTNFLQQRGALANQQNMIDADAENRRRAASNQRLSSITNRGTAFTQGLGAIDANLTTNRAGILDRRTMTEMGMIQDNARTRQADAFAVAGGLQFPTQELQMNPYGYQSFMMSQGAMGGQPGAIFTPNPTMNFSGWSPSFGGVNPMSGTTMSGVNSWMNLHLNPMGNLAPGAGLGMWNFPQ